MNEIKDKKFMKTGFFDKNGEEISENDILKGVFNNEFFKVIYKNGKWIDKDINNGIEMNLTQYGCDYKTILKNE